MSGTTNIVIAVVAILVLIGAIIALSLTHCYGVSPNGSLAWSETECSGNSGSGGSGSL
jgi:hypothetical protein